MSNTKEMARNFLKKATQSEQSFKEGFEAVNPTISPTIGIPITVNLTPEEERQIQKLLVDGYRPGVVSEEVVAEHVQQLTNITKQIKSISAQSILLHGERIQQAQNILCDYHEGSFTKWLMSTYGNRQTPYSMLRYYEFYQSAPKEARSMIEAAPKKCMYLLASRDADQEKKIEFIQNHGTSRQSDLLLLIQSTFPIEETDKRKPLMASTITSMGKLCYKLEGRSKYLSENDRLDIEKLIQRLQKLLN